MSASSVGAWLDRFLAAYYAGRPVNATFIGVHDHDHRLPDFSESGAGDTVAEMRGLLEESSPLAAPANSIEAIDLRLAQGFLRTQIWEFTGHHFHRGNPSLYTGEAIFGVMSLFLGSSLPPDRAVDAATARLAAIPEFLKQARRNLTAAPIGWTERARRECLGAKAFLTEGIARFGESGIATTKAFGQAAALALASFADFDRFLETDLSRRTTEGYAAGPDILLLHLRDHHFLSDSPDEITGYAEAELAKSRAALAARAADPDPPTSGPSYQAVWEEARALAERHRLLSWPDWPIRFRHRPAWAEAAAPFLYFLNYRSPAAFDRPPVHDYLIPATDPGSSAVKLNHVVHHGGIGHHVQNWHAFRAPSRIGRIAAVDCASRIALGCGGTTAEGWACYATDLMAEVGYLTPAEQADELRTRIRMCARAVVDVRLHGGQWSLDQAIDFYRHEAGMDLAAARGEAIKNSMFPGGALMYVMGTDRIHRLRRDLAAAWGPRFSLARFHDRFLSYGSIPVALISEAMAGPVD